jgi:hypothetical protein
LYLSAEFSHIAYRFCVLITTDDLAMQSLKENPVSLSDEKLLLDPKQKVRQYILVSQSEISSALFSPRKNTFLSLDSVAFNPSLNDTDLLPAMEQFLEARTLSRQAEVAATRIIFVSDQHTLLPSAYFREEEMDELFRFHFGEEKEGTVLSQRIDCFEVQLLYRVPASLLAACKARLPGAVISHHCAGLAENFYLQHKNQPDKLVLLHHRPHAIDLVVKAGRKLILLNTFKCDTPEDILYHTLNAYEQLQLNPENESLLLAGDVVAGSPVSNLLKSYIRNVEFTGRPSGAGFSYVFDALPPQAHHALFTSVLCES